MSKIYIVAGLSGYEMEALIETDLKKAKAQYQEMIDDGWEMTDDGFWIKEN